MSVRECKKLSLRAFFLALAVGQLLVFLIMGYVVASIAQQAEAQRQQDRRLLLNVYDGMENDLSVRYLTMSEELKFLGGASDLKDYAASQSVENRAALTYNWMRFLERNAGLFSHARLLSRDGEELLHLRYDEEKRSAEEAAPARLSEPAVREQISTVLALEPKQIYIFRMQPSSFEDDFSPVMRLGMPVYDRDGEKFGMIMLTYRAKAIIDSFRRNDRGTSSALSVLNGDGLWLYNQAEPEKTWKSMTEKSAALSDDIPPDLWRQVKSLRFSSYYDKTGLHYHFKCFLPLPYVDYSDSQDYCIIFMSTCSPSLYAYSAETPLKSALVFCWSQYWGAVLLLIGLSVVQALCFARYWARRNRFRALQNLNLVCESLAQLTMKAGGLSAEDFSAEYLVFRFRELVGVIASNLAMPLEHRDAVVRFAPLANVGKLALPAGLCRKSYGELTSEEKKIMRRHVDLGRAMCEHTSIEESERGVLYRLISDHHEDWDGRGYPDGMSGGNISVEGRLCRIACFYDDLRLEGQSHHEARRVVMTEGGRALDPSMVNAFMAADPVIQRIYDENDFPVSAGERVVR